MRGGGEGSRDEGTNKVLLSKQSVRGNRANEQRAKVGFRSWCVLVFRGGFRGGFELMLAFCVQPGSYMKDTCDRSSMRRWPSTIRTEGPLLLPSYSSTFR